MNKIAKSIKRLRVAQNLSQEELAEKLFVSRQAVSSWENNRTQPDIEMISKLSEVFNVSIEELIYGEKRKVEIDNEAAPHINKNFIIVFSVLGSLFVGLSLVFFLLIGWENFSLTVKSIFSFLPLLAGQGFALFTYFKKIDKVPWRESSAILWCVGVISTFALINGIYNINISSTLFLVAVCLTILPAIYIFDAVSPLIPYFALSLSFSNVISNEFYKYNLLSCVLSTIFIGVGILYTICARKKDDTLRRQFGVIISCIAFFGLLFLYTVSLDNINYYSSWTVLFAAYFTGLVAYGNKDNKVINVIGSLGLMGTILVLTFLCDPGYNATNIFTIEHTLPSVLTLIFKWVLSTAMITAGFLLHNKSIKENKLKLLKCISGITTTIVSFIFLDEASVIFIIIAMLTSVVFMLSGTKDNKFLDFNIGLLALLICIIRIILMLSDDILLLAIIFLISGVALLATNLALLKKAKKEKTTTPQTDGGESNVQE